MKNIVGRVLDKRDPKNINPWNAKTHPKEHRAWEIRMINKAAKLAVGASNMNELLAWYDALTADYMYAGAGIDCDGCVGYYPTYFSTRTGEPTTFNPRFSFTNTDLRDTFRFAKAMNFSYKEVVRRIYRKKVDPNKEDNDCIVYEFMIMGNQPVLAALNIAGPGMEGKLSRSARLAAHLEQHLAVGTTIEARQRLWTYFDRANSVGQEKRLHGAPR